MPRPDKDAAWVMNDATLLSFRQAVFSGGDGLEIGALDWGLERGARVRVEGANPRVTDTLFSALAGRLPPLHGAVNEWSEVVVQGDFLLREQLDGGRSIQDYLDGPDVPAYVWLENRRRATGVLLDRMGLSPQFLRRPLKFQPDEVAERFLAFRFLTSRADLLLAREIFQRRAPEIRDALQARLADFPGTVVAAGVASDLPFRVERVVRMDTSGAFSLGPP